MQIITSANPSPSSARNVHARLQAILDVAEDQLARGDTESADELVTRLDVLLGDADERELPSLMAACRAHPVHALLLEDPYTARAYRKPRGYAGDAVMLDYVYEGKPEAGTSELGAAVFRTTTGCSTARSVVTRRDVLARRIDEVAAHTNRPNVLALASGHLREAARSSAVTTGALGRLVAIDQDRASLAVVERDYGSYGVTTLAESVGGLLKGRMTATDFDFAYAAGLFDYLDDRTARSLLRALLGCLRPGGRLLVANFTKSHQARVYMSLVMDWVLVRRDASDLVRLTDGLEGCDRGRSAAWTDDGGNVSYLELVRC